MDKWFDKIIKPKEYEWVIVKDKDGIEYDYHAWIGHAWYEFVVDDDGSYDGWRTPVDIVNWKYRN